MYKYDNKTGQYRGASGKFVSRAEIAHVVAQTVDTLADQLSRHTDDLIRDKLSVADWQSSIASELKNSSIQMSLLASGGGDIDKSITVQLNEQFDRLDKFGRSIARGELSVPQIQARARNYANSTRVAFYQVESISKARSGLKSAKRILDNQAKHCPDCLRYASLLYVPLSQLISPGTNCECNAGCKCSVVYRYY
jgi:hypothetical protein